MRQLVGMLYGFLADKKLTRGDMLAALGLRYGTDEATVFSLSKAEPATFKVDGTVPPPEPVRAKGPLGSGPTSSVMSRTSRGPFSSAFSLFLWLQ